MNEKYFKRDNETELDYHKRLIYGKLVDKTLFDEDYAELSTYVYGKEYSSDVCRRMMYGSRYTLELTENNNINNITDQDVLDKIDTQQMELRKERYKLSTEKNEINKWLREQARIELFAEKIDNAIDKLEPLKISPCRMRQHNDKHGILTIADAHYGAEFIIRGLRNEILNQYSIPIFEQRMWNLYQEVVEIVEKENLDKLTIINLSDSIEGLIHMSQLQSLQCGVVDSLIGFAEFMSNWLNELSNHVCIDYYSVLGNHTELRPFNSKAGEYPQENGERLITWYLRSRLEKNLRITVYDTNNYCCFFSVFDTNILALHGQHEKDLEKSLKDYMLMYGEKIDLLLTGHLHCSHEKTVGMDAEFVQSPSIMGINEYSAKIRKSARPGSKLLVMVDGEGKKITYDIKL